MNMHQLFSPPSAAAPDLGSPDDSPDVVDLVERLRSDQGPQLWQQMQQQLQDMRAKLRQRAEQGADSPTYAQLQAALLAVDAAQQILQRLNLPFSTPFNPSASAPTPPSRSTP